MLGIKKVEERLKAAIGVEALVHVVHSGAQRRWVIELADKTDLEILLRAAERQEGQEGKEKKAAS